MKRGSLRVVRFAGLGAAAWLVWMLVAGGLSEAREARMLLWFLASLILPVWCCVRREGADGSWTVDLFQPGAVLACLFYVYFVVPAWHVWRDLDYQSDWIDATWPPARLFEATFVLCLASLIAFAIGYRFRSARRQRSSTEPESQPIPSWPRIGTVVAIVMLVIGLPFRMYHLAAIGGMSRNVLLFLSPTYQVESGVDITGVPTFFETFFDWGALLLLLRAMLTSRWRVLSAGVIVVAFVLAYIESGKRSAILPFLLFPMVWIHYLKHRVSVRRGLAYFGAAFALVTALLFMRTIGPLLATTGFTLTAIPADIALAPVRFYVNSPELAVFDMTMLAVQDRGPLLHEIGGALAGAVQFNLAPLAYVVPRFLWPGKPAFVDLGQVFYQHSLGGRADIGFSVGIIGGLYIFAGIVGVLLGMAALGVLFHLVYQWLRPWGREPGRVFLYGIALWMAFHLLRFGTLGSTGMYLAQFELPGIAAAVALMWGRRDVHDRLAPRLP